MSPSCSFMCSMSRSLLVDSKPQMQQQNKSTQYSMLGPGCGWLRGWEGSCAWSFPWGLGDSLGHWEVSVEGAEVSTGRSAAAVMSGSAGHFTLSFGRSETPSSTAVNLWGALRQTKNGIIKEDQCSVSEVLKISNCKLIVLLFWHVLDYGFKMWLAAHNPLILWCNIIIFSDRTYKTCSENHKLEFNEQLIFYY